MSQSKIEVFPAILGDEDQAHTSNREFERAFDHDRPTLEAAPHTHVLGSVADLPPLLGR